MQQDASRISFGDTTTSTNITKTNHTHAIIQNDGRNKGVMKYVLLPVTNLVDFGRPLKTNDIVTYKLDRKSRGTNRGKIVLFGA